MRSLSKTYSECQDGRRRGSRQARLPLNPHRAQPLSNSTSCTHEIHSNLGLPPREAYISTAFQQPGTWWCIQMAVTLEDSPSWPFRLLCYILQRAEMLNGLLSCALLLLPSYEDYTTFCFHKWHALSFSIFFIFSLPSTSFWTWSCTHVPAALTQRALYNTACSGHQCQYRKRNIPICKHDAIYLHPGPLKRNGRQIYAGHQTLSQEDNDIRCSEDIHHNTVVAYGVIRAEPVGLVWA